MSDFRDKGFNETEGGKWCVPNRKYHRWLFVKGKRGLVSRGSRLLVETPHQDSRDTPLRNGAPVSLYVVEELFREEPPLELRLISASNVQYSNYPTEYRRLMRMYANNARIRDPGTAVEDASRNTRTRANYLARLIVVWRGTPAGNAISRNAPSMMQWTSETFNGYFECVWTHECA